MKSVLWPSLLMFAALAGCNTVQDPFLTGSTVAVPNAVGSTREIPSHLALAHLPGAGKIMSVRQTTGKDSVSQRMVFAANTLLPGENALTVELGPAGTRKFRQAPTMRELHDEMNVALPGLSMRLNPTIQQNSHGIYGYATAKLSSGGGCVYAWQITRLENRGASIRLRLCDRVLAGDQLAKLMTGLVLNPSGAVATVAPIGGFNTISAYATDDLLAAQPTRNESSAEPPRVAAKVEAKRKTDDGAVRITMPYDMATAAKQHLDATTQAATVPLPGS